MNENEQHPAYESVMNKPLTEITEVEKALISLYEENGYEHIAIRAFEEYKKINQCQSIIATLNGDPVRCEHPATREAIAGRSFVRVCDRCFECFYCTEKSLEK